MTIPVQWGFLVLGLAALACSSHPQGQLCTNVPEGGLNGSVQSAIIGDGCGGLNGSVAAGQPCKSGADCAPTCCACGSLAGGKSASVGYCKAGLCTQGDDTCCAFLSEQNATVPAQRTCQ